MTIHHQVLLLIEAGAATQVLELAAALRGSPLPAPAPALVAAACTAGGSDGTPGGSGGGVSWELVSGAPEPTWRRALLVSDWLTRWAARRRAHSPVSAWLAEHAVRELAADVPPEAIRERPAVRAGRAVAHGLLAGTAELLRHHLAAPEERCCIDLVSEDRADWQRSTPAHRAALQALTADWIVARLPP